MKNEDVLNWKDVHSCVKIKKASKLGKMSVIQLRRSSKSLFFKLNHVDAHSTELDFLWAKFELKLAQLMMWYIGTKFMKAYKSQGSTSKAFKIMRQQSQNKKMEVQRRQRRKLMLAARRKRDPTTCDSVTANA
ncbi:unnamed protein product [Leuciscus chuanchicus]